MTPWKIAVVLVLVAANAFFVASEFALVSVRRTRIQELVDQGVRRAIGAQKAISQVRLMLSATQLGITFSSLGLGAIGEAALAQGLERTLRGLPASMKAVASHGVAVGIAFALITFLHVVLGEQIPKILAISGPEKVALWVASPIRAFAFAFRPFIWLLNGSAGKLLKLLGAKSQDEFGTIHSSDELAIIIEESRRGGALKLGQSRLLTRSLEFSDKRAVEAMIPRVAAETVGIDAGLDEVLDRAQHTGYSRFPVWRERPDEFVGVVHLKDMLREARKNPKATVKDALREALLVPESLPLEDVLTQMRLERNHLAIVLDEFGSTAGILTMEDIIEEVLGEIRDEYDIRESRVREVEGGWRVPGSLRPDELMEASGCELPEGEYETIAGFILERLGRLAQRGDEVSAAGFQLRVANVRRRRILSVDVKPHGSGGAKSAT